MNGLSSAFVLHFSFQLIKYELMFLLYSFTSASGVDKPELIEVLGECEILSTR